jgi:hypothetical protein
VHSTQFGVAGSVHRDFPVAGSVHAFVGAGGGGGVTGADATHVPGNTPPAGTVQTKLGAPLPKPLWHVTVAPAGEGVNPKLHDSVLVSDTAKLSPVGETDHVPLATAGCEPAAQVVAVGGGGGVTGADATHVAGPKPPAGTVQTKLGAPPPELYWHVTLAPSG